MTLFDEREKGFEAKYRQDQENAFKVAIRRDKLLGLWAAGKMGLGEEDAAAYARSVIEVEFTESGHDVLAKVTRDLAARGIAVTADTLRKEVARLTEQAKDEILGAALSS